MQETTKHPTTAPEETDGLAAAALQAEAWAGEPFLRADEDPALSLAPGTSRRRALDEAIAEIAAGRRSPSPAWKTRFGLMLGLERVLSERPPRLASGTELRRHQIDALAGMLTELIAYNEEQAAVNGNGNGAHGEELPEPDEDDEESTALEGSDEVDEDDAEEFVGEDSGAARRFRFRHPTASGKTIAAGGFVEAARTLGVLILTHRRLLVSQFDRDLTHEGYAERFHPAILKGLEPLKENPLTIQTYAWFARHVGEVSREAYQLVICDEAHTALGEKTSAAIRSFPEPIYIGMTATEELIAKQVSDVFPASVDDLPLADRDRFDTTPGIVYAAGVDHAYNLAKEFRATGLRAEAVSGRTPPVQLAETLAAYERGEINVLINAMLLAEGWNSPRATVCMHLAPTASKRVYQQRIGRIMRTHPRKEAGIVVDFVPKSATHNDRVVSLHSLLEADFYREGARVTPAPRRRVQRRARRRLTPAPWLVPVTPNVARRLAVIAREWQRVDPRYLDEEEQRYWASIAGRQVRFEERVDFVTKLTDGRASKGCLEQFLATCAAENPNRRLRMTALADRVSMIVERADFDDLVTLVTQAPTWEKDRIQGVRILLRAIADGKANAPEQIVARWTWKLARATRKVQDRRASSEFPEAKRLLGALANSRGHRHEENAAKLVNAAIELPRDVGVALLASAEGYTPRSTQLIEAARERLGTLPEVAAALAENLPAPKVQPGRSRRRRRRKRKNQTQQPQTAEQRAAQNGSAPETAAQNGAPSKPRRRRRRKPVTTEAPAAPAPAPEEPA